MRRSIVKFAGAIALGALVSACGGGGDPDIAEVAEKRGLTALLAAATKAGLADELADNDGNLTVFAPSNAAFNTLATQLGFADATAMVNALPASALASILSYHVLPSAKSAATLTAQGASQATLYSFDGSAAALTLDTSAGVRITDAALTSATVTTADVDADNGVVHVIDKVLVPPGVLNVVQMAQVNPTFSVLVEAVVAADLAATLSGTGPFTVFAPTNGAFTAALTELSLSKDELLASPDLASILTYHVVAGDVRAADVVALPKPAAVPTVQGNTFSVGADLGITDQLSRTATLVATDVIGSNGVIHVIDKVLLPGLAS
jgi:transforming growth factor-beta-induced protein